jgi:hypothetical protein
VIGGSRVPQEDFRPAIHWGTNANRALTGKLADATTGLIKPLDERSSPSRQLSHKLLFHA